MRGTSADERETREIVLWLVRKTKWTLYGLAAIVAGAIVLGYVVIKQQDATADTAREASGVANRLAADTARLASRTAKLAAQTSELAKANHDVQVRTARQARVVIRRTCERQNRTLKALRTIIARGDRNLAAFYAEGTITRAQYERAVRASIRARNDLHDDNCTALARKIPTRAAATRRANP